VAGVRVPATPDQEVVVSIPVKPLFKDSPTTSRVTLEIGGMTLMLTSDAAKTAANAIEEFCTRLDPDVDYSVKVSGSEPALAITRLNGMVVLRIENNRAIRTIGVAVDQAVNLSEQLRRTQGELRRMH
jgi:hypothetical protein